MLYNRSHNPVIIRTHDNAMRRRLANLANQHPTLCKRIDKQLYPNYDAYEIE
jgi:hypothetical protein